MFSGAASNNYFESQLICSQFIIEVIIGLNVLKIYSM